MLRITIDLVPFGEEKHRRTIGEITITNDGTGNAQYGNYKYHLKDEGAAIKGELKEHNRLQSVFKLLRAVLNKALD